MAKKYAIKEVTEHDLYIEGTKADVTVYGARFTDFPVRDYALGIDPGDRNMGMAHLVPGGYLVAAQIRLGDADNAVERLMASAQVVREITSDWLIDFKGLKTAIECAAYSKLYGQVALAENRSGAIQALLMAGADRILVPSPGTIRKVVFGSAKIKAEEQWPELGEPGHHDAASALAVALYALMTRNEPTETVAV